LFEEKIETYELKNESIKMTVVNIGASIVSLEVKDRLGKWTDVVLGFSNLEDYQVDNDVCFGSVVGRNANRRKK
jgi:aldose 1-epimerase